MKMINLDQCVKRESKVLSGREDGIKWRKSFKLDKMDKQEEKIEVEIPEYLYSINASFFLGLFGDSVRTLGEYEFRKKYIFKCDDVIKESIDEDIRRAVKEIDILKG
ncbi:hypothetical protein FDB55_01975 [Clostridium botulinum]|uniref:hypothetical protein n=1 Tax=Clostridium botulinum TaxID=1491 RepID=UPI0013F12E48|nr:hypothetical protein [Clostridium botulinum]MCS6110973.1 hypothetical protein [Clostridium botulinum]NFE10708.1 hypothetical protein [Clostridium botulinum]NFL42249.1 hypothetical protein [Clostridium botulinum]NFN20520.1 hypothetical protein [Clostridium botulinum]NFN41266.1 hypothetical protein [Clostridium botulinum]